LIPRVVASNWRLKMLDLGTKCVDCTALMAFSLMFVIFAAADDLLMELKAVSKRAVKDI
jgi:hypothetical protein